MALLEVVAVRHHITTARGAVAKARSAPNEWHRGRAAREALTEVDTAEARLLKLLESARGLRWVCRRLMVELDGITGDVQALAASLKTSDAKVIDFPVRRLPATRRRRRRAENRPRVNNNLHLVTDDAPAAC
ncbi:hypothetical protein WMF38_57265 [Sorangium sp. So ce118]